MYDFFHHTAIGIVILTFLEALALLVPLLIGVAYLTYAERKVLAAMQLRKGPWIRLYGFTSEIVLNAQLQTVVSLLEYADTTGDQSAAGFAQRLLAAAQAYFPSFDTGDWSRYELRGAYASRSYQEYVTTLLRQLAAKTEDPFWTATSQRFRAYLLSPATITQPVPTAPIWPQPADGYLDTAILQISLSQRASVTLAIAGKVTTYRLSAGAHTLSWKPPDGLAAGTYPVSLSTVTYAGNRANSVSLQGSFNFSDLGFSSDEQFQLIPGRAVYNRFARDFTLLWKDRQARAPSPVSKIPTIEGRYSQNDLRLGRGKYRYMDAD